MEAVGYNQALDLVVEAFAQFVDSSAFVGVFSSGVFYDFCSGRKNFKKIDKDFRYSWNINFEEVCERYGVPYREYRAPISSSRSARRTAMELIELAKIRETEAQDQNLVEFIAGRTGRKKTVANASLQRSVGTANMQYLVEIDYDCKILPDLTRDDLKDFFSLLREKQFRSLDEFRRHIRKSIAEKPSFDFRDELSLAPNDGWVYLFPSSQTRDGAIMVKCGKSERDVTSRLDEHVLTSLMPEMGWAFVLRSNEVDLHEKELVSLLAAAGESVDGTRECFWVELDQVFSLWQKFLGGLGIEQDAGDQQPTYGESKPE